MHHSEQKCTHFCSEWYIMGYGTGALWDLWFRPINPYRKIKYMLRKTKTCLFYTVNTDNQDWWLLNKFPPLHPTFYPSWTIELIQHDMGELPGTGDPPQWQPCLGPSRGWWCLSFRTALRNTGTAAWRGPSAVVVSVQEPPRSQPRCSEPVVRKKSNDQFWNTFKLISINILSTKQQGHHFADNSVKCDLFEWNIVFWLKFHWSLYQLGPTDKK